MPNLQSPSMNTMKRKSIGDINEHAHKRLAMNPIEPAPMNVAYQRNIQPRPSPNGFAPPSQPSPNTPQASIGRKRGRPSKAEKEAQARANATAPLPLPLAPAPLAPHPAPPPPPPTHDHGHNAAAPTSYRVSSSPVDVKTKKRGPRPPISEKTQPVGHALEANQVHILTEKQRGLPDSPLDHVERVPALANLISGPAGGSRPSESPAVQEVGRRLSQTMGNSTSQAPTAQMDQHARAEPHRPVLF
jgi:hypothetical protein